MLSVGIRCGQGFDRETLRKLIETGRRPYEFDFLILGNNPGGIVCAKEIARQGKKVALVYWRIPTPGEEEGYDEDRQDMAETLFMSQNFITDRTHDILEQEGKTELMSAVKFTRLIYSRSTPQYLPMEPRSSQWWRKVRGSRLDLANATWKDNPFVEIFKKLTPVSDMEGLTYIHDAAVTNDILRLKKKNWKLLSWRRMMERVLDHIIQRNWNIMTDLLKDKVSLYGGYPIVMNEHSVKVLNQKDGGRLITANTIISALEVHNTFPKDVAGAREYGVNLDDFFRLSTPPGKTLIVGAGPRGMECAGILASFNFPVVVVDRLPILRNEDSEIVTMIVKDLESKGVTFMEKTTLISIKKNKTGETLVADFYPGHSSEQSLRRKYSEEFDTILFSTKEKIDLKEPRKTELQFEIERLTRETYCPEEKFLNIIVIPDRPHNVTVAESIGKHVAGQLLDTEENVPTFKLVPNTILTPFEYAYLGMTKNSAVKRIGEECIQVFAGYIPSEDIIHNVKDHVCYAKIITMIDKDLVIGLHLLGRDAVDIMRKVIEQFEKKMTVSDLHPTLKSLLPYPQFPGESDEVVLRAITT